jgi:predicted ATPase
MFPAPAEQPVTAIFETTRHDALERLASEGGHEVRRRHAAHVLAKCEDAGRELKTVSSADWRERYKPYLDNLRAALTWCFSPAGDAPLGAQLVAQSVELFDALPLHSETVVWIDRALSRGAADGQPELLNRLKLWRSQ